MEGNFLKYAPTWTTAFQNWLLLLVFIIFVTALAFGITAIYNIYFHPLSKYPGPKLAASTDLLFHYTRIMGNQTSWTYSMHSRYGEVVRLGPSRLSYINPQAWKDIYGPRTSGKSENPKDTGFFPPETNGEYSMLAIPDPETHGRVRRIFSNAFSDKALKLQEPLIKKYVDQLIENMQRAVAGGAVPLDLEKMYNFTTFDIMGDLTFGEPLGLLQQSKYTPWVEAVFGRLRSLTVLIAIMNYPLARYIGGWLIPSKIVEEERVHFEQSALRVNRRLEKDTGENKPDIWSLVLEKGTEHLTLAKMHANASLFMVAGTETTATILSGLTFYLLKNPDKLKKLVDELRVLREDELTLEVLPRLPYLNACFQEGLRVYPSVPNGFPREIAPGGNVVCGEWLPAKTSVIVSQAVAYRSPVNFKDPDSFIPERWLPGTGFDTDRKDVLQPFSVGPRNCIGKNLAYHEVRKIIASVLWHFDLELSPLSTNWADQKTYVNWHKPELWVKAKVRPTKA